MIVPSIDIVSGRVVQLVGGEELVLEAGDPRPLLRRFARVGEVAVVDIDAARGEGDNAELIVELCRIAPIRVGGGIRDLDRARWWLDAGAEKVVIGTAATPELLGRLPAERVIVALDARRGEVVTHGWRTWTGRDLIGSITELEGLCGGFLVTFVEREGRLQGTDLTLAKKVIEAAGQARVTIAGGITTAAEVAALDAMGADAQVGMALYTGALHLADGFAAPLRSERPDGLWPTVVADEGGTALGLAWSSGDTLREAIETGKGVYHSRSRGRWVKGETSGATQELFSVSLDCDRDTILFTVHQHGTGFCHLGSRTCWGEDRGLARLERRLGGIIEQRPPGSNTVRLADDPALLSAKLAEETSELVSAASTEEVKAETADLLYFLMVKLATAGVSLAEVESVLDSRERRVTRRPMQSKDTQ